MNFFKRLLNLPGLASDKFTGDRVDAITRRVLENIATASPELAALLNGDEVVIEIKVRVRTAGEK